MPYMPCSVDASIRDKINFIGGQLTDDAAVADLFYSYTAATMTISLIKLCCKNLKPLLISDRHIALVDLTANYTENEL